MWNSLQMQCIGHLSALSNSQVPAVYRQDVPPGGYVRLAIHPGEMDMVLYSITVPFKESPTTRVGRSGLSSTRRSCSTSRTKVDVALLLYLFFINFLQLRILTWTASMR